MTSEAGLVNDRAVPGIRHVDDAGAGLDIDKGAHEASELGERKYAEIKAPVLAIFANPHKLDDFPKEYNAAARAAYAKFTSDHTTSFVHAFQTGVPGAEVVSIPNADHYVFQSNEFGRYTVHPGHLTSGGLPKAVCYDRPTTRNYVQVARLNSPLMCRYGP